MTQTRTGSLVESLANIAVGFGINWTANMLVLPLFGFAVTATDALGIGVIFTVISLVRSYVLRRWFNGLRWGHRAEASKLTVKIDATEVMEAVGRDIAQGGPVSRAMMQRFGVQPGREHAP